jgi:hypothetical protein
VDRGERFRDGRALLRGQWHGAEQHAGMYVHDRKQEPYLWCEFFNEIDLHLLARAVSQNRRDDASAARIWSVQLLVRAVLQEPLDLLHADAKHKLPDMTPQLDLAEQDTAFRVAAQKGADFLARYDGSHGQLAAGVGVQKPGAVVGVGFEAVLAVVANVTQDLTDISCCIYPRVWVLSAASLKAVVFHAVLLKSTGLIFFRVFFRVVFLSSFAKFVNKVFFSDF